jgi:diguanylate cyclase (GGDEF)-like protein
MSARVHRGERAALVRLGEVAAGDGDRLGDAVAAEVGRLLTLECALVLRADNGRLTTAGRWFAVEALAAERRKLIAACRRAARGLPPEAHSTLAAQVAVGGHIWGTIAVAGSNGSLPPRASLRLEGFVELIGPLLRADDERRRLAAESRSDPLTGLPNRRLLEERLVDEAARARRAGQPLALVCLDLDGLKAVNDRFGHAAGDDLLCEVARRLRATARRGGIVARQGGDEFSVLVPDSDVTGGYAAAERLRLALHEPPLHPIVHVTASCGVACLSSVEEPERLLQRADAALYVAKAGGGDQTRIHRDELSSREHHPVARALDELQGPHAHRLEVFLDLAVTGDAPGLARLADAYAGERGVLAVWQELIHPALAEVARRVYVGELTREDVLIVELTVGDLVRLRPVQPAASAPVAILACAPPRSHQLTLETVAPLLTLAGFRPLILPPPSSVSTIVRMAERFKARLVGISAELADDFRCLQELVPAVSAALPQAAIGIGRALGLGHETPPVPTPAVVLETAAAVYGFAAEARARERQMR